MLTANSTGFIDNYAIKLNGKDEVTAFLKDMLSLHYEWTYRSMTEKHTIYLRFLGPQDKTEIRRTIYNYLKQEFDPKEA